MDNPGTKAAQTEMRRHTLRFRDAELEARYRAARVQGDLRQVRVSIIAGAVINVGFTPLDYLILTENLGATLILRIVASSLLTSRAGWSMGPRLQPRVSRSSTRP
jgi:hypothetical protein